jgi:hypothetical protein
MRFNKLFDCSFVYLIDIKNEKIKELALHQLEKRKRLGRWEQGMKDD